MIAGTILATMARPYVAMAIGGTLLAAIIFGGVQTYRLGNAQDDLTITQQDVKILKGGAIIAIQRAKLSKVTIEREQDKVTTHANDDLNGNLAAFRDGVRKAAADRGSTGKADLPRLSYNPDVFAGPDPNTVVFKDDARLCGVAVLRLIAAQKWAVEQSQIDRSPE